VPQARYRKPKRAGSPRKKKLRAYNEALRKVRGEIFVEQEAARRKVLEERQAAVSAARFAAQRELQAAKKALARMWKLRGRHSNNPASCWPVKLPKTFLPEGLPAGRHPARGGSMKSWRRAKPVFASDS